MAAQAGQLYFHEPIVTKKMPMSADCPGKQATVLWSIVQ